MTSQYIPGQGYTVRDARGRVIASGLTRVQRDDLLGYAQASVLSQALLDAIKAG